MAKKQDPIVARTEELQRLFSDPVKNYDAIAEAIREQQDALVAMRDAIQLNMEWLSALQMALLHNKIIGLEQSRRS